MHLEKLISFFVFSINCLTGMVIYCIRFVSIRLANDEKKKKQKKKKNSANSLFVVSFFSIFSLSNVYIYYIRKLFYLLMYISYFY